MQWLKEYRTVLS